MVYLLHFVDENGNSCPYKHARHYTGWCPDGKLKERLAEHAAGHGARLTQVCHEHGITFVLARTWKGGRTRERQIKKQGGASRLCPICKTMTAGT